MPTVVAIIISLIVIIHQIGDIIVIETRLHESWYLAGHAQVFKRLRVTANADYEQFPV